MRAKNLYKLIGTMTLVMMVIGGVALSSYFGKQASAQAPGGMPQAMPVTYMTIKSESVKIWNEFSARLEPLGFAEVRPQVGGTITQVHFNDGDMVKAGQPLFTIDPRPYQAAVSLAKADLQAAQNRYSLADKELKRASGLIESKAISTRVYDARQNEKNLASAQIAASKAKLEQAQINLDYATVTAPISGKASRVEVKQGNVAQAGPAAPILTTIVAADKIYADFEVDERTYISSVTSKSSVASVSPASGGEDKVDEKQSDEIEAGEIEAEQKPLVPVELSILGGTRTYQGAVDSFDNQLDITSGTIRARALFDNKDGALLPGMFAQIKMGTATEENRIMIPEKAIGTDQDRKFVYVVTPENTVGYRQITLGQTSNGNRIVESGLNDGDKIITEGIIRLRPDMPVDPKTPEEMEAMKQAMQAAPEKAP
jgi:multidrug efflux system membrane fusion protein